MGGAGALTLGLTRARHFAYLTAILGQAVPRNHRPSRLTQLSGLYGPTDGPVWDDMDLTRVLRDSPEAQDQYVFVRHAKDDPTIHFGAAVLPSPLTGDTLYDALQGLGIGHLAIWDEGGHGPADPVLGSAWWDDDFSVIHDDVTFVRQGLAFPAFRLSSADGDPGDGTGNGKQDWGNNAGYAGDYTVAGRHGVDGRPRGGAQPVPALGRDAGGRLDRPVRGAVARARRRGVGAAEERVPERGRPASTESCRSWST
jgi:hypothetical protein